MADQRADTPRTAAGRALLAMAKDHGPTKWPDVIFLAHRILAIEAEAAAEPATAEPLDPLGVEIRDWRAAQPPRGSLPPGHWEIDSYGERHWIEDNDAAPTN